MLPQGQSLVDTSYFDSLTARINAIQGGNACAELQAVVNAAAASIQAEMAAIRKQIQALLPLITLPTDLPSVISWIKNFATPMLTAYANLLATETAVLAAVAKLEAAIANAAARLTQCSITIPPIT